MSIIEYINQYDYKDRDKKVQEYIEDYIDKNIKVFNDGIYEDFIIIGPEVKRRFIELYHINEKELNEFKHDSKIYKSNNKPLILNDNLKLLLLASYHNTKKKIFLDFVFAIFAGSSLFKYFGHYKGNPKYVAHMRYAIAHMPEKSFIKKAGNLYGALQLSSQALIDSAKQGTALTKKLFILDNDNNLYYILGVIRTKINDMINRIKAGQKEAEKNNLAISFSKDIIQGDDEDAYKVRSDSMSTFMTDIKNIVDEYDSKNFYPELIRVANLIDQECKYITLRLLFNTNLFHKYADIYLEYYSKNYLTTPDDFSINFINKMTTARMNDKRLVTIDNEAYGYVKKYLKEWFDKGHTKDDVVLVRNMSQISSYLKRFKNYVIFVIRKLYNKI